MSAPAPPPGPGPALPRVVLVVGPTASGKTGLAIALAEALGGEIVNADSVQIYRGFDIGASRPTPAELARVPHHLVGVLEPDDPCDAARFAALADAAIADIRARGRHPLVVGGTGLWFRALVHGLADIPAVPPAVRDRVQADLARLGPAGLHERLRAVDPAAAARIAPQDPQRTARALEVYEATGQPLSSFQQAHGFGERRYDALVLAIDWPRPTLYERINRRVGEMMAAGFLAEVDGLLARGVAPEVRPLRSLGYAELVAHRRGELTLDEAVRLIAQGHRHYAKRQLTWFRPLPETVWLAPGDHERALALARAHLRP